MKRARLAARGLGLAALALFGWMSRSEARADTLIIELPGDHPRYAVEAEPHLLLGLIEPPGYAQGTGIGLGARATIPIVYQGFVSSINNSVAIGFGIDFARYGRGDFCRGFDPDGDCNDYRRRDSFSELWFPVVLQWNFFLSRNWSVFGEPGFALNYHSWDAPTSLELEPLIFFAGGRYHFADRITLTMRLGYPAFSVGVSFLL
jgi:hypothetical protein